MATAVAAIGMDEDDNNVHVYPSKHVRESGDDSMSDTENDDEREPKHSRNGKDEPAYYRRTVSVPFSECAY